MTENENNDQRSVQTPVEETTAAPRLRIRYPMRRRTRNKAQAEDGAAAGVEAPKAPAAAEGDEPTLKKTVRRRAPRKTEAEAAAPAVEAAAENDASQNSSDAPAEAPAETSARKPRVLRGPRMRRTKLRARTDEQTAAESAPMMEGESPEAQATESAEAGADAGYVKKPRRAKTLKTFRRSSGHEQRNEGADADALSDEERFGRFERKGEAEEAEFDASDAKPARAPRGRKPGRNLRAAPQMRGARRNRNVEDDDGFVPDQGEVESSVFAPQLFDAKVLARGRAAKKKELVSQSEKLHKVLADLGLGSRRDMEQLILEGRISVNSEPAHLGQRIMPGDIIRMNGRVVKRMPASAQPKVPRVLVYHKPAGEIVSMSDPQRRPTVFEHLPKISGARWIAVGRLDFNTEGLLLFTTSGELANRLMHPRYQIEREYAVRAAGTLTDEGRRALLDGVMLEDGPAAFSMLEEKGGDNLNKWYLVRISEGRNREVRRMFAAVGLTVSRLIRVRYGAVHLPADLPRGGKRELQPEWVQAWISDLKARDEARTPAHKKPQAQAADKKGVKGAKGMKGGKSSAKKSAWQPDPLTSTVNYIASGKLGAITRSYGRTLAASDPYAIEPMRQSAGNRRKSYGRGR